jgi:integrase/recombinase XerD
LRSLLTFLYTDGLVDEPLAGLVPKVAARSQQTLPKALESGQVEALLSTCDLETITGRRNRAILLLLVRLGLRGGEVAALQLGDMDWRRGELEVAGKAGRHERLPLPADVGEAIVAYLHDGRPGGTQSRYVFVGVQAPHRGLTTAAVSTLVAVAGRKAGLGRIGAHRLRHTAATSMLRAGAGLEEIGNVLRHSRVATTANYAKVDREALRGIARPWPQGPCR